MSVYHLLPKHSRVMALNNKSSNGFKKLVDNSYMQNLPSFFQYDLSRNRMISILPSKSSRFSTSFMRAESLTIMLGTGPKKQPMIFVLYLSPIFWKAFERSANSCARTIQNAPYIGRLGGPGKEENYD